MNVAGADLLTHRCEGFENQESGPWGPAVGDIFFMKGKWQVEAGIHEYYSTIVFCPFCGVKLAEEK
jgi:hypothetical protein